ncbi:MAG: ADP-ribosylglycohydrolase family protein [Byssovorax sp.]
MLTPSRIDRLTGTLLGTAVGDALGLPREGLSRRRAERLYGNGPLRHRFLLGRGMLSDDTEHACMTAQALLAAPDDEARFARALASRLRGWLAAMPAAVGWGTLRAILKLWIGFSPARSGVISAGNGPAMRAPILGASLAFAPERLPAMVRASTHLTHRDARAEEGALVVARAAAHTATSPAEQLDASALLDDLARAVTVDELRRALGICGEALARGDAPERLAERLGMVDGVSGYMLHTVPAALFCWLASPRDFRRSMEAIVRMGGDTDSTGAIVGGLSGATVGAGAIPGEWIEGLCDWPRSVDWMRRVAERLCETFPERGPSAQNGLAPLFWPALVPRNLLFLVVVLAHGLRRLAPPY